MAAYILPLLMSAAVGGILSFVAWQHRRAPGGGAFVALTLNLAVWALGYAMELASADWQAMLFWDRLLPLAIGCVPVFMFVMVLQFTGEGRWLTRWRLGLLFIICCCSAARSC